MKVKDLIEKLQNFPEDMDVWIDSSPDQLFPYEATKIDIALIFGDGTDGWTDNECAEDWLKEDPNNDPAVMIYRG